MRQFDYANPTTLDETIELVGKRGAGGTIRPLAGGTDLLTLMKADIVAPERLINIKGVEGISDEITVGPDGLTLGALATLASIENHPALVEGYRALAEAAGLAATPQLRNMATVGGNLLQRSRCWYFRNPRVDCWLKGGDSCPAREGQNQLHALFSADPCVSVHPSDLPSALLALDASVNLRGAAGERTLPLGDFFALPTDDRRTENVLQEGELVLSISVPTPAKGARSTYLKAMERKVWAFALVGVAASLRLAADGKTIEDARIVLTGVAPIPWRVEAGEKVLIGSTVDDSLFDRAAQAALAGAEPLEHNEYKVTLAKALIKRALQELTGL